MSDNLPMKQYNFIDLFAGCGGLSLGLEQAGFKPAFVNELSPDALDTYLVNRNEKYPYLKEHEFHCNDIAKLLEPEFMDDLQSNLHETFKIGKMELDLITGGPPCQGYSRIGHRRSYSVDRELVPANHLYDQMAGVIEKMLPKMFLFENVEGLLSSRWTLKGRKGEIWDQVLNRFRNVAQSGYNVEFGVLQSSEYGVPQRRPRVFIVGLRKDIGFEYVNEAPARGLLPCPVNLPGKAPTVPNVLGDLVDEAYDEEWIKETLRYPKGVPSTSPLYKLARKLRSDPTGKIMKKGQPVTEQLYTKHNDDIQKKFQYMIDHGGKIHEDNKTEKFAQRLLPTKWGESGPNITVSSLPDDYVHWKQPRILTVREWARLQTFPDWYVFKGNRTTGGHRRAGNPRKQQFERELPRYTQIGNAVPVELARHIGSHFINKFLQKS